MLGVFLSLLSAATFGLNIATLRRGVIGGSVFQAIAITVPVGVPLFALGCLIGGAFGQLVGLSLESWGWFVAAGIVHFVGGRYSNYRATRALGANQSGPIQQVSLLISLTLAFVFLDESITPLMAIGILLILVGPILVFRQRGKGGTSVTRSGIKLDYVEGYVWGLLCAAAFGTSPLLIRFGLEGGDGVLTGLAGGLISYSAAAILVLLMIALVPGLRRDVTKLDRTAAKWFTATGFFVCLSQMFVYMALAIAPVVVVQPIQRTALLFRVVFSWFINRDHEVFDLSTLVAIVLSMIGVLAVTIDTELFLELVPLPAWMADIARQSWP